MFIIVSKLLGPAYPSSSAPFGIYGSDGKELVSVQPFGYVKMFIATHFCLNRSTMTPSQARRGVDFEISSHLFGYTQMFRLGSPAVFVRRSHLVGSNVALCKVQQMQWFPLITDGLVVSGGG